MTNYSEDINDINAESIITHFQKLSFMSPLFLK